MIKMVEFVVLVSALKYAAIYAERLESSSASNTVTSC